MRRAQILRPRGGPLVVLALLLSLLPWSAALGAPAVPPPLELRFSGKLHEREDLSAVESFGRFLVVGSDEGERVQLLEPLGDGRTFRVRRPAIRLIGAEREADVEGLAVRGETLYVLGSHALKRRLLKPDVGWAANRARLYDVAPEPFRHRLYRVALDPESGRPTSSIESIDLRPLLESDPLLGPFTRIPDKENGLSLEGLAADADRLWIGCRSPVLREGLVPVIVLAFDEPAAFELLFVRLKGRGIRGLTRVGDGFLLLAVDERAEGAVVYHWDGRDQIPGRDRRAVGMRRLAELPSHPDAAPEGIALLEETGSRYDVVIVHDGPAGGRPIRRSLPRPAR